MVGRWNEGKGGPPTLQFYLKNYRPLNNNITHGNYYQSLIVTDMTRAGGVMTDGQRQVTESYSLLYLFHLSLHLIASLPQICVSVGVLSITKDNITASSASLTYMHHLYYQLMQIHNSLLVCPLNPTLTSVCVICMCQTSWEQCQYCILILPSFALHPSSLSLSLSLSSIACE